MIIAGDEETGELSRIQHFMPEGKAAFQRRSYEGGSWGTWTKDKPLIN